MRMLLALSVAALLLTACTAPTDPASIYNFRSPLPAIDTSGQPTAAQFDALPAAGYTHVVQLRPAAEPGTGWEEQRAQALGLEFTRIPIAGAGDLTRANVDRLAAALAPPTGGKTLLCCKSSNRSGALLALKAAWKDGASAEEAIQLGKAAGVTRLEARVRELLQ